MKKTTLNLFILLVLSAFHSPYKHKADKAFMIKATQGNLAEVAAAKLALAQSSSDSVKAFAQMMIDDHTAAQTELALLAKNENVTLPDSTDDQHRIFAQRLMQVSGKTFDSAYMAKQVQDHIQTIALFNAEIRNGQDAQTKAYATKLLPKLQMHLQHAQSVAGSVGVNNMQQQ